MHLHGLMAGALLAGMAAAQTGAVRATYERLQGIEPGSGQTLERVAPLLTVYKQQLREMAGAKLREGTGPAALQVVLERALAGDGIGRASDRRPYGGIARVAVLRPVEQPGLVAVTYRLRLGHGTNSSLTIYRKSGSLWTEWVRRDGTFYSMGPPQFTRTGKDGTFLMLVDSGSEDSVNECYGEVIELDRVDALGMRRRLFERLFHGCLSEVGLEEDWFRLEVIGLPGTPEMGGRRPYPYRFQVRGDVVRQVQPLGYSPDEFLDHWGQLDTNEAAAMVAPAQVEAVRRLLAESRKDQRSLIGLYGENQSCDKAGRRWQVEWGQDGAEPVYFVVEHLGRSSFRIVELRQTPLAGCRDAPETEWAHWLFEKPLRR